MTADAQREAFLREAIRLAQHAVQTGAGGPFGAVVVRAGEVVGRGWNQVTSANDPTAHAEVVAIREACRRLNTFRLDDCEIFASCEPCPMCLGAILWARLGRLWYAATHEDAAAAGFDDAAFYRELARPGGERQLPTVNRLREEGQVALRDWLAKPDRIAY